MLDTRVALPLVIFFAMGAATLWLVWRVVVAGGRARREKAVRGTAAEIARRSDELLRGIQARADDVRRRKTPPGEIRDELGRARSDLEKYRRDAAALARSAAWGATATALADDIERAARSIDLLLHGSALMAESRAPEAGEGEMTVKRGYLNLVHAREAIQERREEIMVTARAR